jgi:hypothetical protein
MIQPHCYARQQCHDNVLRLGAAGLTCSWSSHNSVTFYAPLIVTQTNPEDAKAEIADQSDDAEE